MNNELFPADDGHGAVEVTPRQFMDAFSYGVPDGANIGCLRVARPMNTDLSERPAPNDYLERTESDWNYYVPCASFFHGGQWESDHERYHECLDRWLEGETREPPDYDAFAGVFSQSGKCFAGLHFVLIESLGEDVPVELLQHMEPSWRLEYHPGVTEAGFILERPVTEFDKARALIASMEYAGLCVRVADGPWVFAHRPPERLAAGKPSGPGQDAFRPRVVSWRPDLRYTVEELISGLALEPYLAQVSQAGLR